VRLNFAATKTLARGVLFQARKSPLIKQNVYIAKAKIICSKFAKGYFPQLTINGGNLPKRSNDNSHSRPGISIESISKDQYKAVAMFPGIYDAE
jgi:hypothetical protein